MKTTTMKTAGITAALALMTTGGLAACGSDEKAPAAKDAWSKAQDRVGTYKTLKASFTGTVDGKSTTYTSYGDADGEPASVDLKTGDQTMEAVSVNSKQYSKANAAYWKSVGLPTNLTSKMTDTWIEAPSSSTGIGGPIKEIVKGIQDDKDSSNKALLSDKATVSKDSVDGKDAWKITSEDKKTTAWVSRDDKYDLYKLEGFDTSSSSSSKDKMDQVTITEHDKTYDIKAPSGAKSYTDIIKGN